MAMSSFLSDCKINFCVIFLLAFAYTDIKTYLEVFMNIKENKKEQTGENKRELHPEKKEDFSHIKGDLEDFIFFFSDNKRHSEK